VHLGPSNLQVTLNPHPSVARYPGTLVNGLLYREEDGVLVQWRVLKRLNVLNRAVLRRSVSRSFVVTACENQSLVYRKEIANSVTFHIHG
jgi:hypothetical protein